MSLSQDLQKLIEIVRGLPRHTVALGEDRVYGYLWFLRWPARVGVAVVFTGLLLFTLSAFGLSIPRPWTALYVLVACAGFAFLYVAMLPVGLVCEAVMSDLPALRQALFLRAARVADIVAGCTILAAWLLVKPPRQSMPTAPLFLLLSLALAAALASRRFELRGGGHIARAARTAQLLLVAAVVIASLAYPKPIRALLNASSLMEDSYTEPMGPHPLIVDDPERIPFTSGIDGTATVWYYRSPDGRYELYDNWGTHRPSGTELKATTSPQERAEITQYFRAEKAHAQADAEARAEDARRRELDDQNCKDAEAERLALEAREHQAELLRLQREENDRLINENKERQLREDQRARQEFLDKHIADPKFLNQPDTTEIVIAAVDAQGGVAHEFSQALKAVLTAKRVRVSDSFFTPDFIKGPFFEKLAGGSPADAAKLELAQHADWVLFCRLTVDFPQNQQLAGVFSANVSATISIIDATTGRAEVTVKASQPAASALGPNQAVSAAVERVASAFKDVPSIRAISAGD